MRFMRTALVWHRRDLRVDDHPALSAATRWAERVVPIFVLDNAILHDPLTCPGRVRYLCESLSDLADAYARRGGRLILRRGVPHEELLKLARECAASKLFYHRDTDRWYGRERDRLLQERLGTELEAMPVGDNGVNDGPNSRVDWAGRWEAFMKGPLATALGPLNTPSELASLPLPDNGALGVPVSVYERTTPGGWRWAQMRLRKWESAETPYGGVDRYGAWVGRPLECENGATSRLSAPLSFGCISLRTVVQASWRMQAVEPASRGRQLWHSRLAWHDHFTQKLRDFPEAQFRSVNPVYDTIRQDQDPELWERWTTGTTGFPLVDASMRALRTTGFLNFRMRAMVASFWTYLMWQPWQPGAEWFQRNLIDFDTAINHEQWQMQSGTVGWHANRFYDPVLQAEKFDPDGAFIDRYCPELTALPMPYKAAPWKADPAVLRSAGVVLGRDWPEPAIDRASAVRRARRELNALAPAAREFLGTEEGQRRASGTHDHARQRRTRPSKPPAAQLTFDWE